MIDGFFRQPAGRRQQRAELAAQESVDLEVGGADRAAGGLLPRFERMTRPGPLAHRHLPGLAAYLFEALAIDHGGHV